MRISAFVREFESEEKVCENKYNFENNIKMDITAVGCDDINCDYILITNLMH